MSVALSKSPFDGVTPRELAGQVSGAQTLAQKSPFWASATGIYYPPKLHLEQASSEITARFKAGLVSGEILVDLTGGMGLDTSFFAAAVTTVHYCEIDLRLAEITAHNFAALGIKNIVVHAKDGLEVLRTLRHGGLKADWLYADPARRGKDGGKVFRLEEYTPDVLSHLAEWLDSADNLLLKTSPLLDITQGIRQLGPVKAVYVIGVHNEVKELLWHLQPGCTEAPRITAMDLARDTWPSFTFHPQDEQTAVAASGSPEGYLFEPHAALMKAGAFRLVAQRLGLKKLHPSTHLYTAQADMPQFPGRRFEILGYMGYKAGKPPLRQAHVVSRNFPLSVAQIRSKNRISPGGDTFLFYTTLADGKKAVITARRCTD